MIDRYRASFPDCLKVAWESETRLTPTNHVASTLHGTVYLPQSGHSGGSYGTKCQERPKSPLIGQRDWESVRDQEYARVRR